MDLRFGLAAERAIAHGYGHRIMVQIQSIWFPLDDRNPRIYIDNIFYLMIQLGCLLERLT